MDELKEIKMIWMAADLQQLPDEKAIHAVISKFRRQLYLQKFAWVALALLLAWVLRWVWLKDDFQLITTSLGILLMAAALVLFISIKIRAIIRVSTGQSLSNDAFLHELKAREAAMYHQHAYTQTAGFMLASAGLLFYLYETVREQLLWLVTGYLLAIGWIIFCWMIVRPKMLKRQKEKLQVVITKLEKLSSQLHTE